MGRGRGAADARRAGIVTGASEERSALIGVNDGRFSDGPLAVGAFGNSASGATIGVELLLTGFSVLVRNGRRATLGTSDE